MFGNSRQSQHPNTSTPQCNEVQSPSSGLHRRDPSKRTCKSLACCRSRLRGFADRPEWWRGSVCSRDGVEVQAERLGVAVLGLQVLCSRAIPELCGLAQLASDFLGAAGLVCPSRFLVFAGPGRLLANCRGYGEEPRSLGCRKPSRSSERQSPATRNEPW